jgi:hypothetical protein
MNPRPAALDAEGHALSRYIERWHPGMHPRDARQRLEGHFLSADFVEREDGNAQSIWRTSEGTLLVVDDHGVVRTVLPRR